MQQTVVWPLGEAAPLGLPPDAAQEPPEADPGTNLIEPGKVTDVQAPVWGTDTGAPVQVLLVTPV